MTPRWEAIGAAYGVRFIVTLWQEDIDFLNAVKGLGISMADFTPSENLDVIVKRYDAKRGLSGVSGVFHEQKPSLLARKLPRLASSNHRPQRCAKNGPIARSSQWVKIVQLRGGETDPIY